MEHSFRRKQVLDHSYLKQLVVYIHRNPVKHGLCSNPIEYPWSSYQSCVSLKDTKLQRDAVVGWFGDDASFKRCHEQPLDLSFIENWLEL